MAKKNSENDMLPAMVSWFRATYPEIEPMMVHVPRANYLLQKKGATYGSADLIILHPNGIYASLCVQVLTKDDRDSVPHKRWRVLAENEGNRCVAVRDLIGFVKAVEEYMIDSPYE